MLHNSKACLQVLAVNKLNPLNFNTRSTLLRKKSSSSKIRMYLFFKEITVKSNFKFKLDFNMHDLFQLHKNKFIQKKQQFSEKTLKITKTIFS
jgi:hypothetical protein